MSLLRLWLLATVILLSVTAHAQPAPEAQAAAEAFLDKMHLDAIMPSLIDVSRPSTLDVLQRSGVSAEQAGEAFDRFLKPEFVRRLPELRARFRDVLLADFTLPELQAIVKDEHNEARQAAAAKTSQLQAQFGAAGSEWGGKVGQDAFAKNRTELEALGFKFPPSGVVQ